MKKIWIPVVLASLLLLQGCSLEKMTILTAKAGGKVTVPETTPQMKAATAQTLSAGLPWVPFVDAVVDIFSFVGGTRKKAMKERMNYEEWRSFTIFHAEWKKDKDEK